MNTALRFFATLLLGLAGASLHAAGSLKVTLTPTTAISAGAQWRVDAGAWQASGATVKGLSNGTHNVEFKTVTGWIAPGLKAVNITNGTTTLTGTYVQAATLSITLNPTAGQWRVDGGAWRSSATTASGLAPGSHTIDYAPISGYTNPASENMT